MDFIFMLTRGDKTVKDCLETVEISIEAGIKHIGFKDIGVDLEILKTLNKRCWCPLVSRGGKYY